MAERIPGYCALCVSRCGCTAVVDDGRFVALETAPDHPTGRAICAKGRAAPELVYHPERLLYPLKRTRPKGDPDPGWQRISWEEALDLTAARLRAIAADQGPESVVFSVASPSTSASSDAVPWIERLMRAFGSPSLCGSMELCGWGRFGVPMFTYGAAVPGHYLPDIDNAGCILFWGYNPNTSRLTHAVSTTAARKRGARLIAVDPRRAGTANRADVWLQVRPGSDGALALGLAHLLIANDWYDQEFIRDWSNGPFLVRDDNERLLTAADLTPDGNPDHLVAWNEAQNRPVLYDPRRRQYETPSSELALFGAFTVETPAGSLRCRPVFDHLAAMCAQYPPERIAAICGVDGAALQAAAELLWTARPVAFYAWSGVEQQTNATQIARAIGQLYALTGSLDRRGGNVLFSAVPTAPITGAELLTPEQRRKTLGYGARPLGPALIQHVTSEELYAAILEGQPYPVKGLVGFGANLLLAHSDSQRGRDALAALDFYVHADLFMSPTSALADIVLPVASAFEREALKIGFEVSQAAQSWVQLRPKVVEPQGESRGDVDIVVDLAVRLGLGAHFWDGDIEAGYRFQLEPSGISLETLRQNPLGVSQGLATNYRKFAQAINGKPAGFNTPSGKIELFSPIMQAHGYPPLPDYEEPLVSPISRPDLAEKFPLILTCAKSTLFLETQSRSLPSLRRQQRDPEVEIHPDTAAARDLQAGDWVNIATPMGSVRARARLNERLRPDVVVGQHGWWQACAAVDAPGYDAFTATGANYNLLIGREAIDPVSGSVPHRAYLCEISRVG